MPFTHLPQTTFCSTLRRFKAASHFVTERCRLYHHTTSVAIAANKRDIRDRGAQRPFTLPTAAAIAAMPPSDLKKQYMSSDGKARKELQAPRPSSSILLISPTNEILLLHRVKTSTSFASAHVFPGGNLSAAQDGTIPAPEDATRHVDGEAYRIGAIRECFEESGILLAKRRGENDLLVVEEGQREQARRDVHADKLKFVDWVQSVGGELDTAGLVPFTRWITPTHIPKRFTTQMYIYWMPLTQTSASSLGKLTTTAAVIPTPTSDGGLEHTTAEFAPIAEWLRRATSSEIILFPPQFYLMYLLAPFLTASSSSSPLPISELQKQRDAAMEFLGKDFDGRGISWADKVISPTGLLMRQSDSKSVFALDKPGSELEGSGRGGDARLVVLANFRKEGPRNVEVRERKEVLEEERRLEGKL